FRDRVTDLLPRLETPPPGRRQLIVVQLALITLDHLGVLRVQVIDLTDGAHTEANVVTEAMTGKTVASATQAAALLSDGQVIVGAHELPHANVVVTGSDQLFEADLAHRALVLLAAQRPDLVTDHRPV